MKQHVDEFLHASADLQDRFTQADMDFIALWHTSGAVVPLRLAVPACSTTLVFAGLLRIDVEAGIGHS